MGMDMNACTKDRIKERYSYFNNTPYFELNDNKVFDFELYENFKDTFLEQTTNESYANEIQRKVSPFTISRITKYYLELFEIWNIFF